MVSPYEIKPNKLIEEVASELKKDSNLKAPSWTKFVKTGVHKERPPVQKEWWWLREASILRTLFLRQNSGVSRLRNKYGGKRRRGHKPPKFYKGSGSIIRRALQQLEEAGLVIKTKDNGRQLTAKGISLLNKSAKKLKNESGRNKEKKAERTTKIKPKSK